MGISTAQLPDNSPWIGYAFGIALQTVNPVLVAVPSVPNVWTIYEVAVYNLGGSNLINYAPDQPGQTFFADARKAWNINGEGPFGVVSAAGDQGTSDSFIVPDAMKGLTLGDLQNLKDPWGRAYLAIAQKTGTLWGLS